MSKPTLATVKSFIRKNQSRLLVSFKSSFDAMVDGVVRSDDAAFRPVIPSESPSQYDLGIRGAWFVRNSRDYFSIYEDPERVGFSVYNSCGSFVLAIPKEVAP